MANRKITPEEAKRLVRIKTNEKLTWQVMADILGVKEPTLRQISCGRLQLSRKMCHLICDHFPKYSFDWLYNGEGQIFTPEYMDSVAETENTAYAGWSATQLLKLIEEKDASIQLMQQTIATKDELIGALKAQIELLQAKRASSVDRLVSAQLGESMHSLSSKE